MSPELTGFAEPMPRHRQLGLLVAVTALHLVIGALLLLGGPVEVAKPAAQTTMMTLSPPPPIEDAVEPEPGDPAPENRRADPAPVAAPEPIVKTPVDPPKTDTAPVAGEGAEEAAGAGDNPGPGVGAGGIGNGRGGSNIVSDARKLSGQIRDADYPEPAERAREEGDVEVRFDVGTDGRARNCQVTRSSGSPSLDLTTCQLIEARFRYAPARNARGEPVRTQKGWRQRWWLEAR